MASNDVKSWGKKNKNQQRLWKKRGGGKNTFEMASKHHFQLSPGRKHHQRRGLLRPFQKKNWHLSISPINQRKTFKSQTKRKRRCGELFGGGAVGDDMQDAWGWTHNHLRHTEPPLPSTQILLKQLCFHPFSRPHLVGQQKEGYSNSFNNLFPSKLLHWIKFN